MILSIKEEDLKVFLNLGMTKNQTKIYLALLKLGMESNAASLFEVSGVARQDIYRVLVELQKLGLVEKLVATPNRFRTLPPTEAISTLLEKQTVYFKDLEKKGQCFAKEVLANYGNPSYSAEKNQILLINEKQAIMHKAQELIGKSKFSVDWITPVNEFQKWITFCSDSFRLARNNGAKIRWILQRPANREMLELICTELTKKQEIEVKFCPKINVKLGIYDKEEIILAMFGNGEFGETPAILSNCTAIIALAIDFFENNWKKGTRLRVD